MPQDIWDLAAAEVAAENGGQPQTQNTAQDSWDKAAAGDVFDQAAGEIRAENAAPKLQQPVQVKSTLTDRLAGALAPQTVPRTKGAGSKQGDLPGFEGSYASGDTAKGATYTAAGVVSGAALAAPAVVTALRSAAAAHPLVAKVIVKGLEGLGFGAGLKIAGKHMDLLDFLGK